MGLKIIKKNSFLTSHEPFYAVKHDDDFIEFLKFNDHTPDNHARIKQLLETDEGQKCFIHETDLIKFYKEFLIGKIHDAKKQGKPNIEIFKQTY